MVVSWKPVGVGVAVTVPPACSARSRSERSPYPSGFSLVDAVAVGSPWSSTIRVTVSSVVLR